MPEDLQWQDLMQQTVSISVTDMDFSQVDSGLTSEPESLAQWQSRCLQVIQRDSSCVWKILEPQHLHVRHLMPFILVRLQKRQEWMRCAVRLRNFLMATVLIFMDFVRLQDRVLHLTAFITKVCMCKRIISIRKS